MHNDPIPDLETALRLIADRTQSVDQRFQHARFLGKSGNLAVVPALKALLADSEWQVRWGAALALGDLRAQDAVADLTGLLKDPDETVRQGAQRALDQIAERSRKQQIEGVRKGHRLLAYYAKKMANSYEGTSFQAFWRWLANRSIRKRHPQAFSALLLEYEASGRRHHKTGARWVFHYVFRGELEQLQGWDSIAVLSAAVKLDDSGLVRAFFKHGEFGALPAALQEAVRTIDISERREVITEKLCTHIFTWITRPGLRCFVCKGSINAQWESDARGKVCQECSLAVHVDCQHRLH